MNNSTNSTIATPENTNRMLSLIQICFIYYTLVSIVGVALILGKWNENNMKKFHTYLLKISYENICLYKFLFVLSIIFYAIFCSALILILSLIFCIYSSFIDIIIGFYQCCFPEEEKIIPINSDELV